MSASSTRGSRHDDETGFYEPSDSVEQLRVTADASAPRLESPEELSPSSVRSAGPYSVALELASGGMAKVYLGLRDVAGLPVAVAIKQIHKHLAGDQKFIDMFGDEARIAAGINHPAVCRVFDFGKADGTYYIAMEYLQGAHLSDVCRALGERRIVSLDHARIVARVIANLAEGLHAAHELRDANGVPMDVVHRDVSPQNLFVLNDGTVRVTDFGIARARVRVHRTIGSNIKGKLAYLAPEQLEQRIVDRRADIWGLGVVTWELLTGQRLFHAPSEGETVMSVLRKEIPKPSALASSIPSELDAIVLRALSRDAERRYATARDFSRALERFLAKSGLGLSALDVEGWLADLFPGLAARTEALVVRAHAIASEPHRPADSDLPPSVTLQVESAPGIADRPHLAVEEASNERPRHASRWPQRAAGAALAAAVVALGLALALTR